MRWTRVCDISPNEYYQRESVAEQVSIRHHYKHHQMRHKNNILSEANTHNSIVLPSLPLSLALSLQLFVFVRCLA